MKTNTSLSRSVANIVFTPTIIAYGWIVVKYVVAGLILYGVFAFGAYKLQLFQNLGNWPTLSKAALFLGPFLIGLGLYYSTQPPSYVVIVPGAVYGLLSVLAGLALRKLNA